MRLPQLRTRRSPRSRGLRPTLAAALVATLVLGGAGGAYAAVVEPSPTPTETVQPEASPSPTEAPVEPAPEPEAPSTEPSAPATPSDPPVVPQPPAAPEPPAAPPASAAPSAPVTSAPAAPVVETGSPELDGAFRALVFALDALAHVGTEYTTTDGAKYYVPATWHEGRPLLISGSGWLDGTATQGSIIAVKLDEGGVSTKLEVTHPVTGAVQPNKTIYAVAQADATGEWSVELPWPTLANSDKAWTAGETHGVRLLTGSMLNGDVIRTAAADVTTAEAPPAAVAPAVSTQPRATAVPAGTDAVFTASASGDPSPTAQWQSRTPGGEWSDVAGATGPTLTIAAAPTTLSGTSYRAVFTNAAGSATTDAARLTATSITLDKASYAPGETISFTGAGYVSDDGAGGSLVFARADGLSATSAVGIIEATWGGPDAVTPGVSPTGAFPTFQTHADGTFSGTVTLRENVSETGPGTDENEGKHSLTFASNPVYGNPMPATSAQVWFSVSAGTGEPEPEPTELPAITQQPADLTMWSNATGAAFEARTGLTPAPASAQWQVDDGGTWRDLPGKEHLLTLDGWDFHVSALSLSAADAADAAYLVDGARFRVVFRNGAGSVTSAAATLTIKAAPVVTIASVGPYHRGDKVTVSGSGFVPDTRVIVDLGSPSTGGVVRVTETVEEFVRVGGDGSFSGVELTLPLLRYVGVDPGDDGALAAADDYELQFSSWNQNPSVTVATAPFAIVDPAEGATPGILSQPQTVTTTAGTPATFRVEVAGDPTPTVYWQTNAGASPYNWSPIWAGNSGETWVTSSRTTTNVRAVVANAAGWVVSAPVQLVIAPAAAPEITTQPVHVTAERGAAAAFTAAASGVPTPTVQWQSSAGGEWADVPGATTTTLTVPVDESTASGARYRAVFTNAGGSATTSAATLTVVSEQVAPTVTAQPTDTSVEVGQTARFTVAASGAPAPAVQWWSKTPTGQWAVLAGATGTALTVSDAALAQSGTQFKAVFTNAAGSAETDAATLTVTEAPAVRTYTVTDGAGREVTYTAPTTITPGQDIVVSGTNWRVQDGSKGSVFSVLIDATFSGDPNTVYTKREVTNPVTGTATADKRLHAIVEADANGDWTLTVPYPTVDNARLADGSWTDWAAGSSHQIRFLSGTLETRAADVVRSLNATFEIAGDVPGEEPGAGDPPSWAHETVTYTDAATGGTATAWVQKDVDAGDGSTIRIKGTGWVNRAGTGASTVAIKLNSGATTQYTRSGAGVVVHPSATGDNTIWTLLAPSNPSSHANVIAIDADGDFEVEIDAPDGLTAGQYLSVLFQSGRFDSADVLRTVTTGFLTVGGVPHTGGGTEEEPTCVPTGSAPAITIENPGVGLGGTLHVTGTGWCHPAEKRGGSVIAVKIDEGAYSHLTADLHQNQTIWAIIEANAQDGTFDAEIRLPDGTATGAAGSSPAFTEGAHTLRLLTGSLKSGDTVRTVQSAEFVVGAYQPNGAPDPVDAATLTDANANGVTVEKRATALVVTVPGAQEGDWIFLTPYTADGSPRYPWLGTWFQADASGVVVAPLAGATLPVGALKVVAQSGNQGEVGELLGWGALTVDAPPAPSGPDGGTIAVPPATPGAAPAAGRPVYTLVDRASTQAPTSVPPAPFATDAGLTAANAGTVTGVQSGTVVTIGLPDREPGDWVYLYAYSKPIPVGWIQVDESRLVRVDVAALPAGDHKIAVLDENGALIGWTSATITAKESNVTSTNGGRTDAAEKPAASRAVSADGGLSTTDWWLLAGGGTLLLVLVASAVVVRRRRAASVGTGGDE